MRLNTVFAGVAALGILSAAPAFAADPVPPPEVAPMVVMADEPAPAFSWTGGYIGGHALMGRGAIDNGLMCHKHDFDHPIYFIVEGWGETLDFDKYDGTYEEFGNCWYNEFWGALGTELEPEVDTQSVEENGQYFVVGTPDPISGYGAGAQIGFNIQLGQGRVGFVIGAEVSTSITSLAAALSAEYWDYCYQFGWDSEFRINSITTATLRAGLGLGRVLLYGEGGLAIVNATWTNTLGFSDTVNDHGIVYGAGLEIALNDNISIFGEWNRVIIDEHRFIGTSTILQLPTGIDVSSQTDLFKVGFNIRIGLHDHDH